MTGVTGRSGQATATVLFTDLVGSTDLMIEVGEAAFDELRRAHFAALRDAMARTGGEEIKTLGDGVMATFGSATDAVACAVAMQQAAERQGRLTGVPLAVRVGLALGDVSFEEEDVFGSPVVEAARLVAAAQAGRILATDLVRAVARGRTEAAFTDVGPLELKGLSEPVLACEVAWQPLPAPSIPLPALLTVSGKIFVGREDELARLEQLWKEVVAGERRLALVAGEPGIGKTRLATKLAEVLHAEGAVVLAGRCDEDLGVPYQPFVEQLVHYTAHVAHPRLGRDGGELTRLVPQLAQMVRGLPDPVRSDPETERYRLFDAVASWLADVSAETPVLLILDDLQWAAKPTLLLLRHVLRFPSPLRLLVVATYRDTDIGRGHPLSDLLADLRRDGGVERFPLAGFDVDSVASFMAQLAGHELDQPGDELARTLWRETEGNPFFVMEVLRHLFESGVLAEEDGRWVATAALEDIGIPEGVRDVVGRRLSRLSAQANRVLGLASVVGLDFEPAVVVVAGDLSEEVVLSALEEAAAARLTFELRGVLPRNRFAHALVRTTLYDELSAARRAVLHRKVAEAIETVHAGHLDDYAATLAHHWSRAAAPTAEAAKAVAWARRAGDRALSQLAHDEALHWYRQAVEFLDAADTPPGDPLRTDLLIALGEAQRRAGDPGYRETLLSAAHLAQEHGQADALTRAALANNRGAWSTSFSTDTDRVAVLEAALDVSGGGDDARRARLLANLGVELSWSGDRLRPLTLTGEALEMVRRLDDPTTLAHVLLARCAANAGDPDLVADSLAIARELAELAGNLADPFMRGWAVHYRFWAGFQSGLRQEADQALDALDAAAGEAAQPMLRWLAAFMRATLTIVAGAIPEAEVLARKAYEIGLASGQPDAPHFFGAQRFEILYEQGRLEEQVARIEAAFEVVGRRHAWAPRTALTYCEVGRLDEARSVIAPFASAAEGLPMNSEWLWCMATAAKVCAHLDDAETAAVLHRLLRPHADQIAGNTVDWVGSVAHHLGLLATILERFDEADHHFALAAATEERIGAPAWLARTRLESARMLLTRRQPRDAARAQDLLAQALATAQALGLGNVERRALALLK